MNVAYETLLLPDRDSPFREQGYAIPVTQFRLCEI